MDRRDFLMSGGPVLAGVAMAGGPLGATGAANAPAHPAGRVTLPINRGWRYAPRSVPGAQARDFDDALFERVVVPHANVRLPWHGFDDRAYQFVSTYRRRFRLPEAARGQRVFVDFEAVMTAARVWINGVLLGEYAGGYTPFSFELTAYADVDADNVLVVEVDSTERRDIPPFGNQIDYLTFGGIYREVALRIVPPCYLEHAFAQPLDVLGTQPRVEVSAELQGDRDGVAGLALEARLMDGERVVARVTGPAVQGAAGPGGTRVTALLEGFGAVRRWDPDAPHLYAVRLRLMRGRTAVDELSVRIGFREARFTDRGFELNGRIVKLRGLDRHQTFPFVGQAMPARVQRRDAEILRKELKCNIVRTSHYPQSRHFLDACDELGLLVLEEIPGWQHIGDEAWKDRAVDNVGRMIRRDRNRPCIVLWGVRINESPDDHDFYVRTNALAREIDPGRQTGGIRNFQASEFLEDVFTMNDFGFPLESPSHPRYLNTEFVGHTFPTKSTDSKERLMEHTLRHARIHDQLASDPRYAGGLGWCAFDYNTHGDFGSGDRICYHGVSDIFREPKPAAGFYRSQCEPEEEIVVEPAFHWARNDESVGFSEALVCSNCDHLKFYIGGRLVAEADPDRQRFPHLKFAPFTVNLERSVLPWGDLRIEGYVRGQRVIARDWSGSGIDQRLELRPDDTQLVGDGADTTRIVLRVTDQFGAIRPYANDAIRLDLQGPADLIGDNPFALVGGTGAVWVRAREQPGTVTLTATHAVLGTRRIEIAVTAAAPEP